MVWQLRECRMGRIMGRQGREGQPKRGPGANLATRGWRGGAVGWMDRRTDLGNFNKSLLGSALFARLHKRGQPKTGGLIFRRRAERAEGTQDGDEEISAIEIAGSLKRAEE